MTTIIPYFLTAISPYFLTAIGPYFLTTTSPMLPDVDGSSPQVAQSLARLGHQQPCHQVLGQGVEPRWPGHLQGEGVLILLLVLVLPTLPRMIFS